MASPVPALPGMLATADTFMRRFPNLVNGVDPLTIEEWLVEATADIESRTGRRLAPFTNLVDQHMLFGISPDEYGDTAPDMPLDFYGSLGVSYAQALGANDLVRHFWLDHFAPFYPELWTYNITTINLYLTYGNFMPLQNQMLIGDSPEVTTGHCWLRLGTFSPPNTRVQVVYSGGYTAGIPSDLSRACLFQAARFALLETEPQKGRGLDTGDLAEQIDMILAPWARG